MRALLGVLLISTLALAQADKAAPNTSKDSDALTIPAGAQIPLALKQAISTKTAREGDPVYATTTFPFVINDRVLVPAGTYVQGRISSVKRAGRVHGRAESAHAFHQPDLSQRLHDLASWVGRECSRTGHACCQRQGRYDPAR